MTKKCNWIRPLSNFNNLFEAINIFLESKCGFNLLVHEKSKFAFEFMIWTNKAESKHL